jgi:hypothetical protein
MRPVQQQGPGALASARRRVGLTNVVSSVQRAATRHRLQRVPQRGQSKRLGVHMPTDHYINVGLTLNMAKLPFINK